MDEFVDVLTEEGEQTGEICYKTKAHQLGLWHASAQVWFVTSDNEVLLQKRALNKDTYPGLWDISVAGHLSAGDTPKQAAVREIKEEIGLQIEESQLCFLKLLKRSKIPKVGFLDNEFNFLFAVKQDIVIEDLKLQKEEVAEVKLISITDFKEQLKQNKDLFVSHGEEYYTYIIKELLLL